MRSKNSRTRSKRKPRRVSDGVSRELVPSNPIHRFDRIVNLGTITATGADVGLGRFFKLSDLPDYSEFGYLYNQYRISALDVIYEFSTHVLPAGKPYPRIAFCVDHNDASTPTTEAAVLQYANCEVFQFGQLKHTYKRTFKPRAALASYQGTFSGYATAPEGMWFNADNPGVQYYGTKEWLTNYNTTIASGAAINVYVRYHVEMRAIR